MRDPAGVWLAHQGGVSVETADEQLDAADVYADPAVELVAREEEDEIFVRPRLAALASRLAA